MKKNRKLLCILTKILVFALIFTGCYKTSSMIETPVTKDEGLGDVGVKEIKEIEETENRLASKSINIDFTQEDVHQALALKLLSLRNFFTGIKTDYKNVTSAIIPLVRDLDQDGIDELLIFSHGENDSQIKMQVYAYDPDANMAYLADEEIEGGLGSNGFGAIRYDLLSSEQGGYLIKKGQGNDKYYNHAFIQYNDGLLTTRAQSKEVWPRGRLEDGELTYLHQDTEISEVEFNNFLEPYKTEEGIVAVYNISQDLEDMREDKTHPFKDLKIEPGDNPFGIRNGVIVVEDENLKQLQRLDYAGIQAILASINDPSKDLIAEYHQETYTNYGLTYLLDDEYVYGIVFFPGSMVLGFDFTETKSDVIGRLGDYMQGYDQGEVDPYFIGYGYGDYALWFAFDEDQALYSIKLVEDRGYNPYESDGLEGGF